MIAMVVGDHDGPQLLQIEPGLLGPGEEVPLADAAIDEHPLARHRVFHNGGIPAAAAGQYMQSNHSLSYRSRAIRRTSTSAASRTRAMLAASPR